MLNGVCLCPPIQRGADELGPVVGGEHQRKASHGGDPHERLYHARGRHRASQIDGQALTREDIDDSQHAVGMTVLQSIGQKVQCPPLVGCRGTGQFRCTTRPIPRALDLFCRQSCLPPDSFDPLVVEDQPPCSQPISNHPISAASPLVRPGTPLPNSTLFTRPPPPLPPLTPSLPQ